MPLFRTLYRSMMSFAVQLSINCSQRFISAGMNSPIGWNVAHCSAHFNLSIGCIGVSKLCSCECLEICYNRMDTHWVDRANVLREVPMIRHGFLEFSSDLFEFSELDNFVKFLVSWSTFFFMLNIMYEFPNRIKNIPTPSCFALTHNTMPFLVVSSCS